MENKSIIISYDDLSRMKEFCTDSDGTVTRDFMDWYVLENSFFMLQGSLILEKVYQDDNKKFLINFDFSNPDFPIFSARDNTCIKDVVRWSFSRSGNLQMKDVVINLQYGDTSYIKGRNKDQTFFITEKLNKKLHHFKKDIPVRIRMKAASRKTLLIEKNKLEKELRESYTEILKSIAECSVYAVYSTMYYFSKISPKEITGHSKAEIINSGTAQLINTTYKYTGFVNLNESKIYRPVIKKDPNDPVREYERHIEKWFVRGHYRRYGNKTVWIEPHTKGTGNLEQRYYGTDNYQESEIIPKLIPIQKIVYKDGVMDVPKNIEVPTSIIEEVKPIYQIPDSKKERIKPSFIQTIFHKWKDLISIFR